MDTTNERNEDNRHALVSTWLDTTLAQMQTSSPGSVDYVVIAYDHRARAWFRGGWMSQAVSLLVQAMISELVPAEVTFHRYHSAPEPTDDLLA